VRARNGTGQIKRLGSNKYRIRISAGTDLSTGKRKQLSWTVYGTLQDAERKRAQKLLSHTGETAPDSKITLSILIKTHLDSPTRSGVARSPYSRHREQRRFNAHIAPLLGNRTADEVTPQELTLLYDSLLSRGLNPTSVQHIHGLLCAAYSWGNRRGLVFTNPTKSADCPTAQAPPPRSPALSVIQEHLAILEVEDPETALVVRIAATIGLRRNELAGLRWEHIDLVHKTISIVEGISASPGEGLIVTETKTGQHGHGVLSIDDGLVELLEDTYAALEKRAADIGEEISNNAYVFSADPLSQRPLSPDVLTKRLQKHMNKHPEMPSFTLKDLRSFCATQLHATGADVTTAQAVLRHQSSQTTLKYYRAAQMSKVRESTIELGERLAANKPTKPNLE
jgi:integrase